ncbi:MFS transporter [Effusibacillus lacus]|uniref:MFS transporter n=1 Tax=Effusibacillus lacus TaxID=1348429 RepID=A0A292YJB7_9BACL|nr:MFS transporter [Effusibacillus lacus]TCS74774.1 DHA1 family multidrug resistance protein-like MFS transporter [Effusibacillus lacus]GAX88585.1 MFS transporter [Effusibacillus lacus]
MRLSTPGWSAGLWCLQISAFLTNFGFFMLIPLLAVHFTQDLGLSLAVSGILYAVRLFAQQGLMLLGGIIADRMGYKETILVGSVVRSVGFAMFGFVESLPALVIAGLLAGLGGALFSPAWQAATTELSTPENRDQVFAWRNILGNAGMTLGPLAGAWLSAYDIFSWICYISAAIFIFFGFLVWVLLPAIAVVQRDHPNVLADIKHIAENHTFVWLNLLIMGFYMLYQLLYIVIPVLAQQQIGQDIAGYLFAAMSVLVICFQQPVVRLAERYHIQPLPFMAIGMLILGLSFVPAIFSLTLITVVLPVAGIAFSSMFITPTSQSWIAEIAEKELLASYFGFSSLTVAVGGTIGSTGGGWIVDQAFATGHTQMPFVVFSLIGIGSAAGIWILHRTEGAFKVQENKRGSGLHVE